MDKLQRFLSTGRGEKYRSWKRWLDKMRDKLSVTEKTDTRTADATVEYEIEPFRSTFLA